MTEAKTLSYRHGLVPGSWRPDNQDKDTDRLFPLSSSRENLKPDRVFGDPYSAKMEYKINENVTECTIYENGDVRKRVLIQGCVRDMHLDCKSKL